MLGSVELERLSPGQRGALLLIFYLLVDRDRIPIILDQPEENLDNETVYNLLVGVITRAKQHRQVVMVTHNANLAVHVMPSRSLSAAWSAMALTRLATRLAPLRS
jgi:ABC-type lipoprotein export system ATPase subunit